MSNSQAALRHICDRLVALETDKAEIAEEIKTTLADAKSDGFDPALITKTVKLMLMEAEKRQKAFDQMDLLDTYIVRVGLRPDADEEAA